MERRSDSGRGSSGGSSGSKKDPKINSGEEADPSAGTPHHPELMPPPAVTTRSSKRKLGKRVAPDTPHPYRGLEEGNLRVRIGNQIKEGPKELLERRFDSGDSSGGPKLRFRRPPPPPASRPHRQCVTRRLIFESSPDEGETRQAKRGRRPRYPQELANLEDDIPDMGVASRLRSRTQSEPRATTRPLLRIRSREAAEEQVPPEPVVRQANVRPRRRNVRHRHHGAKIRPAPEQQRGRGRPHKHH